MLISESFGLATKRRLETRIKEQGCMREWTEKSAVAEHFLVKNIVSFGMTRRSSSALGGPMELVMKEAVCIRLTPEDARFNRDNGNELPDTRLGGGVGAK